jgi:hypothetical protein
MKAMYWLGILALPFLSITQSKANDHVRPDSKGIIRLAGKMEDGKSISVQITLRHANSTDREEDRVQKKDNIGNDWWGAPNEGPPDRIVSTCEVKVGDNFIPLFRSAYADLADVRSVELTISKADFIITIHGGETGSGYMAVLRFKGDSLTARQVTHNEMGLEEKTDYFPVHDN